MTGDNTWRAARKFDCGGTTPLWLQCLQTTADDLTARSCYFTMKPKRRYISAVQGCPAPYRNAVSITQPSVDVTRRQARNDYAGVATKLGLSTLKALNQFTSAHIVPNTKSHSTNGLSGIDSTPAELRNLIARYP